MSIPEIFGVVFGSVLFLATVGLPLLLTLYAMMKSFLTRGRNKERPFDKYVLRLYDGGDVELNILFALMFTLGSLVSCLVGIGVGLAYVHVGLYILSPLVFVAALFLLRFLFDVGHGLKHNKDTGKLEEIDELRKKIEKIERGRTNYE